VDPLTREAPGLIGKALWPEASQLQTELQPELTVIIPQKKNRRSQEVGRVGIEPTTGGL